MEYHIESSLYDLYLGAVGAFPKTTRRQHSTHTVKVERMEWVPFEGLGTLFVKALCNNEGRKNECIVVFKKVAYREQEGGGSVSLASSAGKTVHILPLSFEEDDVLVRCSCGDFRWRFAHWNKGDRSLFGRGPRKYEALVRPGASNPDESPGACKHLMKMAKILGESGALGSITGKFRTKITT
jgi:hypothetical protein